MELILIKVDGLYPPEAESMTYALPQFLTLIPLDLLPRCATSRSRLREGSLGQRQGRAPRKGKIHQTHWTMGDVIVSYGRS